MVFEYFYNRCAVRRIVGHMPTSLVMGKKAHSSAGTPELTMVQVQLVAFLWDPDKGDKLNLGVLELNRKW